MRRLALRSRPFSFLAGAGLFEHHLGDQSHQRELVEIARWQQRAAGLVARDRLARGIVELFPRQAAMQARAQLPEAAKGAGVWPRTFASIQEQLGL